MKIKTRELTLCAVLAALALALSYMESLSLTRTAPFSTATVSV